MQKLTIHLLVTYSCPALLYHAEGQVSPAEIEFSKCSPHFKHRRPRKESLNVLYTLIFGFLLTETILARGETRGF